jgi:hypothetical protein
VFCFVSICDLCESLPITQYDMRECGQVRRRFTIDISVQNRIALNEMINERSSLDFGPRLEKARRVFVALQRAENVIFVTGTRKIDTQIVEYTMIRISSISGELFLS